jgi:hypothetical protein
VLRAQLHREGLRPVSEAECKSSVYDRYGSVAEFHQPEPRIFTGTKRPLLSRNLPFDFLLNKGCRSGHEWGTSATSRHYQKGKTIADEVCRKQQWWAGNG